MTNMEQIMKGPDKIIVIGSSTGGTHVLFNLFTDFPRINAAILIVQHMPQQMNNRLAARIQCGTKMEVSVATEGSPVIIGKIFIAPSGRHMKVFHDKEIKLFCGEKVNYVCPSIDILMMSFSKKYQGKIMGIVLSGMGKDGTEGIRHIKEIGGQTIVQNPLYSTVRSMPESAILSGYVDKILSFAEIKESMVEFAGS